MQWPVTLLSTFSGHCYVLTLINTVLFISSSSPLLPTLRNKVISHPTKMPELLWAAAATTLLMVFSTMAPCVLRQVTVQPVVIIWGLYCMCEWSLLFIFVFKLLSKNKKVAERWFKAFHIMQHILTRVLSAVFLLCFPSDFMEMYWDACFSHFCTHQIPGWSGPLQFVIQYKRLKNEQYNNRILYCTDMMYFLSGMALKREKCMT